MAENKYIEHYVIPSDSFYHVGTGDFMDNNKSGFFVMRGGGGIGHVPTIEKVRKLIFDYSRACLQEQVKNLETALIKARATLKALSEERNLVRFQNPDFHGYECNYFNGKKG